MLKLTVCMLITLASTQNVLSQRVRQPREVVQAYRVCEQFKSLMAEDLDFDRAARPVPQLQQTSKPGSQGAPQLHGGSAIDTVPSSSATDTRPSVSSSFSLFSFPVAMA